MQLNRVMSLAKNIVNIRSDFPILSTMAHGKPLIYLDNGATTQKPLQVISVMEELYRTTNANVHRGVHYLSDRVSDRYEAARETVRAFINARSREEIIFTAGTTASINAVAFSFGERYVSEGDEIVISGMEHHANIVPWQMLCERKKAKLKIIPFSDEGILDLEAYRSLLTERTRIVAVTHVSNVLGTVNPVKEIVAEAHRHGIPVLVDGAQGIQHGVVDVTDIDCDFYVFSGHKVYGPNGIGVLYGKAEMLNELPPYQGGGDMVAQVTFEKTTYNALPFKFEAGTTNFTGAIGLAAALDYLSALGREAVAEREQALLARAMEGLSTIDGIRIYGTAPNKVSVISFLLETIHQYDAGMILDKMGIAVRTGTHCAQPLMERYGITGNIRASIAFYNTEEEMEALVKGVRKVTEMFA
ncbi:MAG TPA: cysteine desulfurase [Bacteroidales bacterium]|nr:cysteine desulfurase [Bacteroidales bacterium]HPE23491.1 cysteine desulfurase [Bacteroidales bacterium]HPJ05663.1 cysteine desulfurase [Bacteroidales bacterium]HPQ64350.1 cysteine desulfurase [Bacteroidales bacterium]HRW27931.1 cysteine desulfurase [Bacteroidales bacterium]